MLKASGYGKDFPVARDVHEKPLDTNQDIFGEEDLAPKTEKPQF